MVGKDERIMGKAQKKILAMKIVGLRGKRNQSQFARDIGVQQRTVSLWEDPESTVFPSHVHLVQPAALVVQQNLEKEDLRRRDFSDHLINSIIMELHELHGLLK